MNRVIILQMTFQKGRNILYQVNNDVQLKIKTVKL